MTIPRRTAILAAISALVGVAVPKAVPVKRVTIICGTRFDDWCEFKYRGFVFKGYGKITKSVEAEYDSTGRTVLYHRHIIRHEPVWGPA